jgi:hypothetical protein
MYYNVSDLEAVGTAMEMVLTAVVIEGLPFRM